MSVPGLSAVVVNWNARDVLLECVRSLRAAGVDDVVVVDNASSDGSAEAVEHSYGDGGVSVVRTGANLGFGAGANRGAAVARGEALLICNADVAVDPAAPATLAATLLADPGVGVVGPLIENPDGTVYPSPRRFPSFVDALGHAALSMAWPANPFTRRYRQLDLDRSVAGPADWVSGSCFAARRDVWDELGGFDEGFYMYMEDVDLCRRVWAGGRRVVFEPNARVVHVQGRSTDQRPYRMIVAHHRSMARYSVRAADGRGRLALPFLLAGIAVRAALACAHRAVTGRADRSGRSLARAAGR